MRKNKIKQINYHPPVAYPLDLEIVSVLDLRQRVGDERLKPLLQYKFYALLMVTQGECSHVIDFKPVLSKPGSLILFHPGQIHQFSLEQGWDGWIVSFHHEFLLPKQEPEQKSNLAKFMEDRLLTEQLDLQNDEYRLVTDVIVQMKADTQLDQPADDVHGVLRHQLLALLLRLKIWQNQRLKQKNFTQSNLERFKKLQQAVEESFSKWHRVAEYAQYLECSEKSLTRCTLELAGISTKAFIASRINLEAKRLLSYTDSAIKVISADLGFDETTNFVKFFKNETGCTPGEFRQISKQI